MDAQLRMVNVVQLTRCQSFPIASDRPDMSGKIELGPTKYPATSDLQSGYFFGQFFFRFFGLTG